MIPTQDNYIFNVPILGILHVKVMYHIPFQLEKNDGIIRNLSIAECVFWRWHKKIRTIVHAYLKYPCKLPHGISCSLKPILSRFPRRLSGC